MIVSCYPISLGLLKTPGEMDADIAVAGYPPYYLRLPTDGAN